MLHSEYDHNVGYCMYCDEGPYLKQDEIDRLMPATVEYLGKPPRTPNQILREKIIEGVAMAIGTLENGGGVTYNEAREIGAKVARFVMGPS